MWRSCTQLRQEGLGVLLLWCNLPSNTEIPHDREYSTHVTTNEIKNPTAEQQVHERRSEGMTDKDRTLGEDVTIYQYISSRKRQIARKIKHAIGENGLLQTDQQETMRIFKNLLATKYKPIRIDITSFWKKVSCGMVKIPESLTQKIPSQ